MDFHKWHIENNLIPEWFMMCHVSFLNKTFPTFLTKPRFSPVCFLLCNISWFFLTIHFPHTSQGQGFTAPRYVKICCVISTNIYFQTWYHSFYICICTLSSCNFLLEISLKYLLQKMHLYGNTADVHTDTFAYMTRYLHGFEYVGGEAKVV